ncbi:hypothetical protein ES703_119972 [subsurface metagenome]
MLQLYAARTRQDTSGWPEGGWYPDERMGGLEALKAMTTWSAYAAFEDSTRGKILPGYDADLTVLPINPVNINPRALLSARVLMTVVAGQVVWCDREGFRLMDACADTASAPAASSVPNSD